MARCLQIVGVTAIRMLKFAVANYPRENRDSSSRCTMLESGGEGGGGKSAARDQSALKYRPLQLPCFPVQFIYLFPVFSYKHVRVNVEKSNVGAFPAWESLLLSFLVDKFI